MPSKTRLYWAVSALLLAWALIMTVIAYERAQCLSVGLQFSIGDWACVSRGPAIILQRDLQRG